MQELIKYISDILNVKTESVYTVQDMKEELSKVRDIVAYRSYIKDNLDKIDYKTGYQKFILLTQAYLRLEHTAMNPEVEEEAKKIANTAYSIISDGKYNGLAQYHGVEDKKILRTIGGASVIQELLDNETLVDVIVKKLIEKEDALPYEQLPARMSKMISGTTKAIK